MNLFLEQKLQTKQKAQLNYLNIIRDVIMFGFYLAVLCFVVLTNKDTQYIYSNQEIQNMVVDSVHLRSIGLFDVQNTERYDF